MNAQKFNPGLLEFISSSPTPFHAVAGMVAMLESAGFARLQERDDWKLAAGRYYVCRNDSSLIAFQIPEGGLSQAAMALVGAHTDSPCLKVKPNPVVNKQGYFQLGVEVYGGALLNPWFDRDLSLAGRVSYQSGNGVIESALIDFKKAIAVIPSLAIHLDREANKKRSINSQVDIVPVLFQAGGDKDKQVDFKSILAAQLKTQQAGADIQAESILSYELYFYDTQQPAFTGLHEDFISAARLDNLLSCHVGLRALLDAKGDTARLLVCNDHEEVGSTSACGAQGPFLKSVLQRLTGDPQQLAQLLDRSLMISCDNAHAIHPNFSDRHDGNHGPRLNQGPVIKTNANQRYATSSETAAAFKQFCQQAGVPHQEFVTRSDMACGSTIGPLTAAEIGVKTVDVGVPQFAMHSIRETCGSKDPYYLYQVLKQFYSG